ncbi:MAG: prepilin-type N-terminal cleavage/methylation domain-containing protein [Armatimonadota bacterium]|nr:prepilin-type N-terminal cleavage/methylation domain-containing protein [Armatimonadota bacterium]
MSRTAFRRLARRGFTMMEVMLALTVFLLMTLMFAAAFPVVLRAAQTSSNYAQAGELAQHKIDQMRAAGVAQLNYANLVNLNVIDPMAQPPTGLPATFNFASVDNLANGNGTSGYFPTGSTGTITIVDYHTVNAAVPAGQVDYVTVTIAWPGGGNAAGSYKVSAMIVQMTHR